MPPKTKADRPTAATKRGRSQSSSADDSPAAPPATKKSTATPATLATPAPTKKGPTLLAHRTTGPLVRSEAALAELAAKKSQAEMWEGVVPLVRHTKDSDFDPATMMKLATWNVSGLRGLLRKDDAFFAKFLAKERFDVLCLQETKLNPEDAAANAALGVVPGYSFTDHACSAKKGYSGVRTYTRDDGAFAAAAHTVGWNLPSGASELPDEEGRVQTVLTGGTTAETRTPGKPTLALINTYVVNSGMNLDRLTYRTETFDVGMRKYFAELDAACLANAGGTTTNQPLPVGAIWTGDLNVANMDYDRYFGGTYKKMQEISGFTPEERFSFRETLRACDAVDCFRHLYPSASPAYTYYSARFHGREKGHGWRIDYFLVPRRMAPLVVDCFPMPEVTGSDHVPLQLWMRKQQI